jgi:hypothetical protein
MPDDLGVWVASNTPAFEAAEADQKKLASTGGTDTNIWFHRVKRFNVGVGVVNDDGSGNRVIPVQPLDHHFERALRHLLKGKGRER